MKKNSLYDHLYQYSHSDYVPFHMPGHKRQHNNESVHDLIPSGLPWQIDITEIDGFDNLHHAEGILKESMDMAASFYGTEKTLYSINGSTAGILSAIFAVTKPGDTILVARNSHKSVYHAIFLRNLKPCYIYPQVDEGGGITCGYSPEEIKNMLTKYPEIKAVVITSPTYEGVVSDIQSIADIVHEKGVPLVVDEAHGAHFTMRGSSCKEFPRSAVCLGADLVIQSLHKTLPALTQTAVLHVCKTKLQRHEQYAREASRYMSIFQTSSPSYVLMASIDACMRYQMSQHGQADQKQYYDRLQLLRNRLRTYDHISLLEPMSGSQCLDPSKLVLQASGLTGKQFYDYLRQEYHLQPEMCTGSYVLLMTSVFDTEEMYDRLLVALDQLDNQLEEKSTAEARENHSESHHKYRYQCKCRLPIPLMIFTPAEADRLETENILLQDSVGRISAEYAYQYPPGIPLLVPGERIEEDVLQCLLGEAEAGIEIQGLRSLDGSQIQVVKE